MILMKILLMLTQAVFLFYGTTFFPLGKQFDKLRFVCYTLIVTCGFFISLNKGFRKIRILDLFAWSFLIFAFLSHFYSINSELTLQRTSAFALMYFAVFWALWAACRTPQDTVRLLRTLMFIWIIYNMANIAFLFIRPGAAFGIYNREAYVEGYQRFTGISSNPNAIGNFSAIILPLALWNFQQKRNPINLFFLGAVIFSFFFSFSRNAFICSVIGTSTYLFLTTRKHRPLLVVMTVILIGFIILYVDVLSNFLPEALVRSESIDKLGGRSEAWETALELIKKKPYLGFGFGVEDLVFDYYAIKFQIHSGAYVHNSFLGLAVQLGWGAAFFVYFFFTLFFLKNFLRIMRLRTEINSLRTLTIALYASCLSAFGTTFFESWLYAAGGIIAFTFFTCLMFLIRLLDFEKAARSQKVPYVRHRG